MKDRNQTTTTSDQRGPLAPFQEVGISSLVQERLRNKQRIADHLEKKGD